MAGVLDREVVLINGKPMHGRADRVSPFDAVGSSGSIIYRAVQRPRWFRTASPRPSASFLLCSWYMDIASSSLTGGVGMSYCTKMLRFRLRGPHP